MRTRAHALGAVAGLALLASATAASAIEFLADRDRIAIVIGNADYASVPDLPNAHRDATDMAAMLEGFGFTVFQGYDLDRRGFEDLIRTAMLNVPDGADVVFYYAGHGIQIGRRNYLLPVDVAFESVYDLPTYSVTLDRVIEALAARGATHLAIIDACRENPFPNLRLAADLDASLFETQAGFEVQKTPINSLVAFSTSPGDVALDGPPGGNSPYTSAIIATAESEPEEAVTTVFSTVRERVYETTGGRQVPWESSTLVRPFRLLDKAAIPAVTLAQADATPQGERTTAGTPPPPATALVTLPLDRRVALAARIEDALGHPLQAPTLVEAPRAGNLTVDPTGTELYYRPDLAETRATGLDGFRVQDAFRIETGPADARQSVSVTLTLQALGCDFEAGDALDLQGVGLYRLPNEIDADKALKACSAAVEAAPDTARFRYQLGRAQQASGDLKAAFASFAAAADAGHVRALNAEGYLLLSERINHDIVGIPLDRDRAAALLQRGVEAGDPFAMHTLGQTLLRKGQTADDRERGFDLLDRAAELGHTYSMNELGIYFLTTDTDHYLPERGMAYLEASANRDDIYGWHNMGFVALYGLDGNPPDMQKAYDWFLKAANGGHPDSPSAIGRMIVQGKLGDPDWVQALKWYDAGLSRGDAWGGVNAAGIILDGDAPGLGAPDAAIRLAKATLLPAPDAAADAEQTLSGLDTATLDIALQTLLRDMGEDVAVDGAVGPGTRAALSRVIAAAGTAPGPDSPQGRLTGAARAWWAMHPTRADLF